MDMAVVEDGVAVVEEQDLVVELIITMTRTMDNHAKTDVVLMVSLQRKGKFINKI